MHAVIEENLEELLASPSACGREALDHLVSCKACAMELERMRQIARLFPALRNESPIVPAPYFAARVMKSIERRPLSFWASLLESALGTTMGILFFRRVAFASLLVLATLGGYLVSTDSEFSAGVTPELIMAAERDAPASEYGRNQDRELLMVTISTFNPDEAE